ncbi:MAG: T9SS type A sorting domain-containing protein, partial [Bacteroidia bacterium]
PAEKTESPVAEIKNERKASEPNLSQLQAEDLKFFPNPSDGNFSLEFKLNTTGATTVSLMDASGKEIFNETIENFTGLYNRQFDITAKAKGTYLLRIQQGDKWLHKKLVVK